MITVYGSNLKEKGNKDVWTEIKADVHGMDYNIVIEKEGSPLFTINMLTEEVIKHEAPSMVECPNCSETQKRDIPFTGVEYQCICTECENEFYVYKRGEEIFVEIIKQ